MQKTNIAKMQTMAVPARKKFGETKFGKFTKNALKNAEEKFTAAKESAKFRTAALLVGGLMSLPLVANAQEKEINLPTVDFKRAYEPSQDLLYISKFEDVPVEYMATSHRAGASSIWLPKGEVTLTHNIDVTSWNSEANKLDTNFFPAMYNVVLGYGMAREVNLGVPSDKKSFQVYVKLNYMQASFGDIGDNPDHYIPYEIGYAFSKLGDSSLSRHALTVTSVLPLNDMFTMSNSFGFEAGTGKPGVYYNFKLDYYIANDSTWIFAPNVGVHLLDNMYTPFYGFSSAKTGVISGGAKVLFRIGENADGEMNKIGASLICGIPLSHEFWGNPLKLKRAVSTNAEVFATYGDYLKFSIYLNGNNLYQASKNFAAADGTVSDWTSNTAIGAKITVNLSYLSLY